VIIPKQAFDELQKNDDVHSVVWIGKQRAGYGSHGNTLIRASMQQIEDAA